MRRVLLALSLCSLVVSPASAAAVDTDATAAARAQRPHLDMDLEAPECSGGWSTVIQGNFEGFRDRSEPWSGAQSARLEFTGNRWVPASGYGSMAQQLPAADAAGKRAKLIAYIRTVGVRPGNAGLWWAIGNSRGEFIEVESDTPASAKGDTPWTRYELEVDVPADARQVYFGFDLAGGGTAWFDGLSIELNGKVWQQGKPVTPRVSAKAENWLRKNAIPFSTPVAGNGFDDLQPLKRVIGDARIVSLGEGTHGTKEFFQMKHRILEFLVEEMGFTHFGIEANMTETNVMNEFVLNGTGDPRTALRGMYFWTWNTQEVLDMALWMREYNASGKGPIQFLGFDSQYARMSVSNVREFMNRADQGYSVEAGKVLSRATEVDRTRVATADDVAAARNLVQHMESKRAEYESRFAADRVKWAIQDARTIVQVMEGAARIRSRDQSMADNVEWILNDAPGSKIVLWAHNFHASKAPGWMGSFLDQRYGDDHVVLGFAFNKGSYTAVGAQGLTSYEAVPAIPDSVEGYLKSAGMPRFIVDLRNVPSGPDYWLERVKNFRNIGAVATRCAFRPTNVSSSYDGLIWMDETSPSVLLRN